MPIPKDPDKAKQWREKQSQSQRNRWKDEKYKKKMSDKRSGRKLTEEWKRNLSKSLKGKRRSKQTRQNMSKSRAQLYASGVLNPDKSYKQGVHNGVHYNSSYELQFMEIMDRRGIKYGRFKGTIQYELNGTIHHYNPDFVVGNIIVEIKAKYRINDARNVAKFKAAKLYAKENGMKFVVITEDKLFKRVNNMKLGYAFWGFLADIKLKDGKEISTPDGNAFYSWSIIYKLLELGHKVYRLMPNRDQEAIDKYDWQAFCSIAPFERYDAATKMIDEWPEELDLILLEWRFPIPGRNCEIDKADPNYQPDLDIQEAIIEKYGSKTPIVIFDLDYKLTYEDEKRVKPVAVFDTGWKPQQFAFRQHVEIPFDFRSINCHGLSLANKDIAYIGNRYERDRMMDQYIVPLAKEHKMSVHLYGNWLEGGRDSAEKWPEINFHGRVGMKDFYHIYNDCIATPLLAKDEYCMHGFMTARILECIAFGSIPIGLAEFRGIERYLPLNLIAHNAEDIAGIVFDNSPLNRRSAIINRLRSMLQFMDVRYFVETLLQFGGKY